MSTGKTLEEEATDAARAASAGAKTTIAGLTSTNSGDAPVLGLPKSAGEALAAGGASIAGAESFAAIAGGILATIPGAAAVAGISAAAGAISGSLPGGAIASNLPGGAIASSIAGGAVASGLSGTLMSGLSSSATLGINPGGTGQDALHQAVLGAASSAAGAAGAGILADVDMPIFQDIAITSNPAQAALDDANDLVDDAMDQISGIASSGEKNLEAEIASGDKLDVRNFSVQERISSLFQVNLIAICGNPSIDFEAVIGQTASFKVRTGMQERSWSGLCNHIEQIKAETEGKSTYQLTIVPTLWLLTQRRNHRMFQQISEPDIVQEILKEWGIEADLRIDKGAYKKREYRVQYAETDFAFISRMLEDAGISYYFEQADDGLKLVLTDAPHSNPKRKGDLAFSDDLSTIKKNASEAVTGVRIGQRVRPGRVTLRDHDFRRPPAYKLMKTAEKGNDPEPKLERFHYLPGAFLFESDKGESTPVADDKGKYRHDEKEGGTLAQKRLDAKRGSASLCSFESNAHDVAPGMVISIAGHPHEAIGSSKTLLVVESALNGTATGEWSHFCEARSTETPFRPELVTPRPKVSGVESATVVGPKGEEIHTDEFGRVRVHFHWDRKSEMDDKSSCWMHTSHPWAGTGYGGINLPRIGQEVLVDFLSGDPDRPVIVGRVYTNLQKVPYKLPDHKTRSGWKSNSTGNTGGYNEIMFEDLQGKELVNIQAQKDLNKLVKNNETESTGVNRTISVGKNRSSSIGASDSTTAGASHSVTISGPDGSGVTKVTMSHQSIELTTGGATVTLGADFIDLEATNISIHAKQQVIIDGDSAVLINCTNPGGKAELAQPTVGEVVQNALTGGVTGAIMGVVTAVAPVVGVLMGAGTMIQAAADGLTGG